MSTKKLPPTKRLWVEDNGSIYVAEADDVIVDFSKKTIKVRTAIAFNVGSAVAQHIIETHNAMVEWERANPVKHYVDSSNVNDTNRGSK